MSVTAVTITATTVAQSIGTLAVAALGQTTQSLGVQRPAPAPRAAQVRIESDAANTANVGVGGPALSATAGRLATLAPGQSITLGVGTDPVGDTSQLWCQAATGTAQLNIALVD